MHAVPRGVGAAGLGMCLRMKWIVGSVKAWWVECGGVRVMVRCRVEILFREIPFRVQCVGVGFDFSS